MNLDEEADESVETDQPAEPTFVYDADRIAAATGPKSTPEPRLRSMVRNDTGCYQERPPKRVIQAVVHAGALRHFDSPRLGAPRLHHFDGSQAQLARRAPERGPLPRPRVLEGDHASIVRHQSFLSAALYYGLVPPDAVDAAAARR